MWGRSASRTWIVACCFSSRLFSIFSHHFWSSTSSPSRDYACPRSSSLWLPPHSSGHLRIWPVVVPSKVHLSVILNNYCFPWIVYCSLGRKSNSDHFWSSTSSPSGDYPCPRSSSVWLLPHSSGHLSIWPVVVLSKTQTQLTGALPYSGRDAKLERCPSRCIYWLTDAAGEWHFWGFVAFASLTLVQRLRPTGLRATACQAKLGRWVLGLAYGGL